MTRGVGVELDVINIWGKLRCNVMYMYILNKWYKDKLTNLIECKEYTLEKDDKEKLLSVINSDVYGVTFIQYIEQRYDIYPHGCELLWCGKWRKSLVDKFVQRFIKVNAGKAHFKIENNYLYIDSLKYEVTDRKLGGQYISLPPETLWKRLVVDRVGNNTN